MPARILPDRVEEHTAEDERRAVEVDRGRISRTSRVIAMANTPSLNVSTRSVDTVARRSAEGTISRLRGRPGRGLGRSGSPGR
jgi:hypothetical protein